MRKHFDRIGVTVSVEAAQRSCLDKKRYPNRNDARNKAARILARGGSEQRPYRCTLCNGYHLATVVERKPTNPNTAAEKLARRQERKVA